MENERDMPEVERHNTEVKFSFGDKVRTEDDLEGTIVEVEKDELGTQYKVVGDESGWYPAHELTHVE
jgi:hypothetical protein